jgi:hypothetical protein
MGAPEGNKNAQKHNRDEILVVLSDIMGDIINGKAKSLERCLVRRGLYAEKLNHWLRTHKDDEVVSQAIRDVQEINKTNVIANVMEKEIPEKFAMFYARCNMGWNDKPDREKGDSDSLPDGVELVDYGMGDFPEGSENPFSYD